jgi:hypothetical protein
MKIPAIRFAALCIATFSLPALAPAEMIYGIAPVANATNLVKFDSADPLTLVDAKFVSGLQPNESIVGIDLRPSNRQLYALGSTSRLYTLDPATGAATPVGAAFSPPLNGFNFGFDFNPVTDRIRVVSDTRKSFVLNPDTGAIDHFDGDVFYPQANFGIPSVTHSAYTNNRPGAATTQLYGIDGNSGRMTIQNESTGELTPVQLGFSLRGTIGAFDISANTGLGYFIQLPWDGIPTQRLSVYDLQSGNVSSGNPIGGGITITALTVATIPEPNAALLALAAAMAIKRVRTV